MNIENKIDAIKTVILQYRRLAELSMDEMKAEYSEAAATFEAILLDYGVQI